MRGHYQIHQLTNTMQKKKKKMTANMEGFVR